MGSISTHFQITHDVQTYLRRYLPNEEYYYLELGNFLTDVSQFRDPTAQFGAKVEILRQARAAARSELNVLIMVRGIEMAADEIAIAYINDLLGTPRRRHGTLSNYFEYIIRAFTLQSAAVVGANIDEVERIFEQKFTQYYPHEHLDFPPVVNPGNIGHHQMYRPGRRNVLGYLEEFIQYISEQLLIIEDRWKTLQTQANQAAEKREILADLGHVLHAIEDFYFHSNFAEALWLKRIRDSRPGDPGEMPRMATSAWCRWFTDNIMYGRPSAQRRIRYKREFFRRLRFPVVDASNGEPSGHQSTAADRFVYTGGFSKNDIFHTAYDALSGIEARAAQPVTLPDGRRVTVPPFWENTGLVMFDTIFSEENRQRLADDDAYLDRVIESHKTQLQNNVYQRRIREHTGTGVGEIHPRAAAALTQAYDLDRDFTARHSFSPGLGGFLISLTQLTQIEAKASERATAALDSRNVVCHEGTTNGASAEQIGTHSLMAKDTPNSVPMRREALALARVASVSIAGIMGETLANPQERHGRVWWDTALRHFMRFPNYSLGTWERGVLNDLRQSRDPDWNAYRSQVRLHRVNASDSRVRERLLDGTRRRLESRYRDFEERAERAWAAAQ